MKVLVTGAAGFIGFHVSRRMVKEGHEVLGLDSISNYYSPQLKMDRLKEVGISEEDIEMRKISTSSVYPNFRFVHAHLEDKIFLLEVFESHGFDLVIHLAAQPGVRYSLEQPEEYVNSNVTGFLNILEACRFNVPKHLVFASSSSVYGANTKMPLSISDAVDQPVSLYAVTKRSNELMAHCYSHLFEIPITGLRFFTVYGPWGRPDMAPYLFTSSILKGEPISVFNHGNLSRDFTYVDDIVEGVFKVAVSDPRNRQKISNGSKANIRLYNIGNNNPVKLMDFIKTIEDATGKTAQKEMRPMQPGDVIDTYADVSELIRDFGYQPKTNLEEGISRYVKWFKAYYKR